MNADRRQDHQPAILRTLLRSASGRRPAHIHLVGIGGTGLSAIARLLLARGLRVSGSDRAASVATRELVELGARVFQGHRARQIRGADLVLVSSAVPTDNPEVLAAHEQGIPVVKREQFLAPLMAGYLNICVAGSHGKTTTSALLATLLDGLGAEPSFIVGSQILNMGTNARQGRHGGPFVIEADEYDHTFLGLEPHVAVITNVEWDHVDCYPTPEAFLGAFQAFARLVPGDGAVVYCGDDPGARQLRGDLASQSEARWISYGLGEGNDWRAGELAPNRQGGLDFQVIHQGQTLGQAHLSLAGEHNVLNALAALAAAFQVADVFTDADENLKILQKASGTARRLEIIGSSCDIILLDDYAHHPTEVRATLRAVRQRYPRRAVWVLFQPHTYSRTHALLHDFCSCFENADHLLITDIYAAREQETLGVSAQDLVQCLQGHPDARYAGTLETATDRLAASLQPGDLLITLGAGDANQVGRRVLDRLREREAEVSLVDSEVLARAIEEEIGLPVERDRLLAADTTMRIGGPAQLAVAVSAVEDLVKVVRLAREAGLPFLVLGGGSNLLVSDQGVRGLVILNRCRAVRQHQAGVVWAESGVNLAGLARQSMRWGLSGLEWGVSVPGTVGGAVVGNAGAHGGDMADSLLRATLLMPDGSLAEWPQSRFQFDYRHSALKAAIRAGEDVPLVLSAAFQLTPGDPQEIDARAAEFLAHRRATQPIEPSAGSIFQNPPGDYAGRILDSLGFKGRRSGQASFSTVHANFIVNHGGASAANVVALIDEARSAAWLQLGVALTPEILFVGQWDRLPPYAPLAPEAP